MIPGTPGENATEDIAREARGRQLEDDILHVQVKEKVLTPTFVLLCIAVLASSLGALGIYIDNKDDEKTLKQTAATAEASNAILEDIAERESPAAQAARTAAIEQIILQVKCNEREVLEDFADQLLAELAVTGVLPEGTEITLQPTEECGPPPGG